MNANKIVDVLSLIGAVHNCNMINGDDPEITDHYDCREDVKKAYAILGEIIQEDGR